MVSDDFSTHVQKLVSRITYKENYTLLCEVDKTDPEGRMYLQVECYRPDVYSGTWGFGYGGKAYLSEYAIDDEIVRTAFGLFMAYEEHECREFFKVDGVSIFGPHISLDALLEAGTHLRYRDEPSKPDGRVDSEGYLMDFDENTEEWVLMRNGQEVERRKGDNMSHNYLIKKHGVDLPLL